MNNTKLRGNQVTIPAFCPLILYNILEYSHSPLKSGDEQGFINSSSFFTVTGIKTVRHNQRNDMESCIPLLLTYPNRLNGFSHLHPSTIHLNEGWTMFGI